MVATLPGLERLHERNNSRDRCSDCSWELSCFPPGVSSPFQRPSIFALLGEPRRRRPDGVDSCLQTIFTSESIVAFFVYNCPEMHPLERAIV